jgi:hypothetical protein
MEVDKVCNAWEMYKTSFLEFSEADAILRASFIINYFLFKLEFEKSDYPYVFNNKNQVNSSMQTIQNNLENNSKKLTPGFNYRGANSGVVRIRGIPDNATKARKFGAMMLIKKNIIKKFLNSDNTFVSVSSPKYKEAEDDMVRIATQKINTVPAIRSYREVFKYTGYGPESKVMESFFFHSMVMFGWYAFYGIRNKSIRNATGAVTGRVPVATDYPGSCNVQACMNMFYFMKKGILSKLVYIPHGASQVSRLGQINVMTGARARGMDDIQFCHHGFHLAGTEITTGNQNSGTYTSASGYGNWYVRTLYSHSDAFDVITLAPIYRARLRLYRAGKHAQLQICEQLIEGLNTRLKKFVRDHLLSNIPMNTHNMPTGKIFAGASTKARVANNIMVKNAIRALPIPEGNIMPTNANINKVISDYKNFFKNKNTHNFFMNTLHPNWGVKFNNLRNRFAVNGHSPNRASSDPWERLYARLESRKYTVKEN